MSVSSAPPSLAIQGGPVPLVVDVAVTAERLGFHAVWTTEFYNRSAIVTMAALAAATTRIGIGSGIAWAFGRTPLTLATDVRSIDDLCPGRLSLGLGTGNPMVIGDWPRPFRATPGGQDEGTHRAAAGHLADARAAGVA